MCQKSGINCLDTVPGTQTIEENLSRCPRRDTEWQQSRYRNSRLREIRDGIVKSSFNCLKIGVSSTDGASVWLAKGKAMAAFPSAIGDNEEVKNRVQGYQLSEEERNE